MKTVTVIVTKIVNVKKNVFADVRKVKNVNVIVARIVLAKVVKIATKKDLDYLKRNVIANRNNII